jgi:hypothetical protein
MPEYSSTRDGAGFTINSTLNSETDTITMVVTAPNGSTATATQQRFSGDTITSSFPSLLAQLQDSSALPAGSFPPGPPAARTIYGALISANNGAIQQADKAEVAARATGTPVAQNPAPPPSTNNQVNPAVAPAPNNTPAVESPSPPAAVPISSDPAQQQQAAIVNADNTSPAQVSTLNDPAQRAVVADQIAITNAQNISTLQDPAQRAQAAEEIQNYIPAAIPISTDPAQQQQAIINAASDVPAANPMDQDPATRGLTGPKLKTQSQQTQQDAANSATAADWRVRLSLAENATYLYKNTGNEGILLPLAATNGVIFPYTPAIQVQYSAVYDPNELTHSNYKFFSYRSSAVDTVSITCDFTAQDTTEANYLLAVIHFFRSVTKMFYGKDQTPRNGTPPPLCYLSGLGTYQFDNHPLAITGFTYTLPTDVDYIRAQSAAPPPGVSTAPSNVPSSNSLTVSANRLFAAGISPGALANPPAFNSAKSSKQEPTYVPTKISLTISAVPIVTRNDISNNFSLKEYGTGALLRGTQRKSGGGIW